MSEWVLHSIVVAGEYTGVAVHPLAGWAAWNKKEEQVGGRRVLGSLRSVVRPWVVEDVQH